MPFRIESILKREEPCLHNFKAGYSHLYNNTDKEDARGVKSEDLKPSESILHKTLLNRERVCYRSVSDYRSVERDSASSASLYCPEYDWLCVPQGVYYPYFKTENLYPRKYFSTSLPAYPYHYGHHNSKRKGGQVRFTPNQTSTLETRFLSNKYLSPEDRKKLAGSLQLSDRQVKTWFQNRRAKWKRSNSSSSMESMDVDIDKEKNVIHNDI